VEHKSLFIAAAALVVAVLLVPMLASKWNRAPGSVQAPAATPVPAATPLPAPAQAPPSKPVVDASILDKLLYGMTCEQVAAVVGGEADETETQYEKDKTGYTGPTLTVWKTWVNPDGSKLRVGFVESKLEQKQFKPRERHSVSDNKKEKR
jgi:hypothetical protein